MTQRHVIIIGAGLGGLSCGRLLSRRGMQVTILEQGDQPGGALQTFVREDIRFDTGFHSVGGLGPGEPLNVIFHDMGLDNLPWVRMEPDEIIGGNGPFLRLSSGWDEELQHVMDPYRRSIWRLSGGGKTLIDALSEGQRILCGKKVTALEDRTVTCADGSRYQGDLVIAAIHPQVLLRLLRDPVRPAYRNRIEMMENSPGIFTVNAKLRPGVLPYVNHSIFLNDEVMIHFGEPDAEGYARSVDLLAFAKTSGIDRDAKALSMIKKASERLPDLPQAIEKYWTSTPQTWERYTGTPGGSAYGLVKHGTQDYLAPHTPLPWLFLTGQNIGLHGVLGTTISAYNTCKSILP